MMKTLLSHDQDTLHAEKWCAEMRNFRMAALMCLMYPCHAIKAGAHVSVEITHFHTGMGSCYNVSFVEISDIFDTEDALFLGTSSFDQV